LHHKHLVVVVDTMPSTKVAPRACPHEEDEPADALKVKPASDGGVWKISSHRSRLSPLWLLFGCRPNGALWGERPFDLGLRRKAKQLRWFDEDSDEHGHGSHGGHGHGHGHGHGEPDNWWNTPFYSTPRQRHLWGEPQYAMHAGAQELFLDLIFVGVAYRVGVVLKAAFYAC
jgi:hypothetical protein